MTTATQNLTTRGAQEYRAYVRSACKARKQRPIEVVDGGQAPKVAGEDWHYETRGGTWISHPSAYSKHGWSNMVYCSSTIRVEVGREWLAARGIPEAAMAVQDSYDTVPAWQFAEAA